MVAYWFQLSIIHSYLDFSDVNKQKIKAQINLDEHITQNKETYRNTVCNRLVLSTQKTTTTPTLQNKTNNKNTATTNTFGKNSRGGWVGETGHVFMLIPVRFEKLLAISDSSIQILHVHANPHGLVHHVEHVHIGVIKDGSHFLQALLAHLQQLTRG